MTAEEARRLLNPDTREEALNEIECNGGGIEAGMKAFDEACMVAIEALEEVEQYKALGTIEELKEAREKQIAKKPNTVLHKTTGWNTEEHCPVCKTRVYDSYCSGCGQAIDWREE